MTGYLWTVGPEPVQAGTSLTVDPASGALVPATDLGTTLRRVGLAGVDLEPGQRVESMPDSGLILPVVPGLQGG